MKIEVKGAIIGNDQQWIYDWLELEATSPKKVNDSIIKAEQGEELEVEINSGGGSVFAGSEIYTALKNYPGKVTVNIVGLAASSASIIAMAGDKIRMSPTAQIMIHNVSSMAWGDYNEMDKMADILKGTNDSISNAYQLKTGKSKEELLDMMNQETWLTSQEALKHGFIDEVMFDTTNQLVASHGSYMLPEEVINKLRNGIKKLENNIPQEPPKIEEPKNDVDLDVLKAKLNLKIKL